MTIRDLRHFGAGDIHCFYDQNRQPKYFYQEGSYLEQWDVLNDMCDWHRALPAMISAIPSPDGSVLITLPDDSEMICWSRADGRQLARIQSGASDFCLTADDRFMLYRYVRSHWLEPLLRRLPVNASWTANIWLKPSFWWELCDTYRGTTWPAIPAPTDIAEIEGQYRFLEHGSQLTTIDDHGIYEWDLPPRWQYFTPWAWPGLGAWLSLVAIGWKLRKAAKRSG
jgi:hypothetical protein